MTDPAQNKKELLARRQAILEEIGDALFAQGQTPNGFEKLGREFSEIDELAEELMLRLRPMADELEAVKKRVPLLENEVRVLDVKKKNQLGKINQDISETQKRLARRVDQLRRSGKKAETDQEAAELKALLKEMQRGAEDLRDDHSAARAQLKAELDNAQHRAELLDAELNKLRDQKAQLEDRKRTRLRETGLAAYQQRFAESVFALQYSRLESLQERLELMQSTQMRAPEAFSTPNPWPGRMKWMIPLALLILAAIAVFILRPGSKQMDIPLEQMAHVSTLDTVVFASRLQGQLPLSEILESCLRMSQFRLLGGVGISDVLAFFAEFSGTDEDACQVLGLELRDPLVDAEFSNLGFESIKTSNGLPAWTDQRWACVLFSDHAVVMMPRNRMESLVSLQAPPKRGFDLVVRASFPAFGNNAPFLQGYQRVNIKADARRYLAVLEAETPPVELSERAHCLNLLKDALSNESHQFTLEDGALSFEGPRERLTLPDLEGDSLRSWIQEETRAITLPPTHPLGLSPFVPERDWDPGKDPISSLPSSNRQALMALARTPEGLQMIQSVAVGEGIESLTFSERLGCLVLDGPTRHLMRIHFDGQNFFLVDQVTLSEAEANLDPGGMALSPDADFVAVFENRADQDRPPRVALLDAQPLAVRAVGGLPNSVEGAWCAVWSAPDSLLVGVSSSGRGARMADAVVKFKWTGQALEPTQVLQLPLVSRDRVWVPSMAVDPLTQTLITFNVAEGSLARFHLASDQLRPTDRGLLTSINPVSLTNNPILHLHPSALTLNRCGEFAVVMDVTDFAAKMFGEKVVLVDLDAERPVVADAAELGGMPFAVVRLPLTDRFLVSLSDEKTILELEILERRVQVFNQTRFNNASPQHLAVSPAGDLVFASARTR